jgi:Fe-S-cluster containining protein
MDEAGKVAHFSCTRCGKCCRDMKIPLSVAEAMKWLDRGHPVQLICEASPWPKEANDEDPRADHFKRRSFAVMSGSMPTRVVAMLVANITGTCPNLSADMLCGIYDDRPRVCRIYPAEVNPLLALNPEKKLCPPEAWTTDKPLFQRNGKVIGGELVRDIEALRQADALDAKLKSRLCAALHVADAGLVHEAVLVYSPAPAALLAALILATHGNDVESVPAQWRFVSERTETIEDLAANGAVAMRPRDAVGAAYQHFGFEREALFRSYPGPRPEQQSGK